MVALKELFIAQRNYFSILSRHNLLFNLNINKDREKMAKKNTGKEYELLTQRIYQAIVDGDYRDANFRNIQVAA